jgi:hypothetical protein
MTVTFNNLNPEEKSFIIFIVAFVLYFGYQIFVR